MYRMRKTKEGVPILCAACQSLAPLDFFQKPDGGVYLCHICAATQFGNLLLRKTTTMTKTERDVNKLGVAIAGGLNIVLAEIRRLADE